MTLKTNSSVILNELMRRKITLKQAAYEVGVSPASFTVLVRKDHKVRVDTAGKIRSVFGDSAITISKED